MERTQRSSALPWIGRLLVFAGFAAILWELLGYSEWLVIGERTYGGVLGSVLALLGAILISIPYARTEICALELSQRSFIRRYMAYIDNLNEVIGVGVGWMCTVMVLVVFVNVMLRYVFGRSLLALQDMSWYVFGFIFLIGAAYSLKHDRHVRVDVFYSNFPPRLKTWINFLGSFIFLVPFCILGLYVSWAFVERAFLIQEVSPDPGGLGGRYLAKSMILVGFALVLLQGISLGLRSLLQIRGKMPLDQYEGGAH